MPPAINVIPSPSYLLSTSTILESKRVTLLLPRYTVKGPCAFVSVFVPDRSTEMMECFKTKATEHLNFVEKAVVTQRNAGVSVLVIARVDQYRLPDKVMVYV